MEREIRVYGRRALITFLAGAAVLGLIHIPIVRQSIVGSPDREMMSTAFNLRANTPQPGADPAILLDIDDRTLQLPGYAMTPPGRVPPVSTPRAVVADLLAFVLAAPPGQRPAAVIVDVDLAAPAPDGPAAIAKVRAVLTAWAKTPGAPTLSLAREAFPPTVVAQEGSGLVLPASDYDDIVAAAPNIYWATVKVLADQDGVVQDFLPFQCVSAAGHRGPLFHAALLSYGAAIGGPPPKGSPAAKAIGEAGEACARHPDMNGPEGELIDYHLSLGRNEADPTYPTLPANWPGFKICGAGGDDAVFRRVSAADILAAGPDASHDVLCRRLVVIGGTNQISADFQQTPLQTMSGPMILINTARGLQLSKGGLRQGNLLIEGGLLLMISLTITAGFSASRVARSRYHHYRAGAKHWVHYLALLPLNPVVLNLIGALAANWIGVGLLLFSLKFGYWGFLSGPAFGSATAETIQDFTEE